MGTEPSASPIDDVAACLVQWAGMASLIIHHMLQGPEPDCPLCVQDALFELLCGTLAPLADRYAAADLELAAGALRDAVCTISDEILLVDHDSEPEAPR
jgi:hypothetical protein